MDERIKNLATRIKAMGLSSFVLFLLVAHLPLRRVLSYSMEIFHPLFKLILGQRYAEEIEWFLESPDRIELLCSELER